MKELSISAKLQNYLKVVAHHFTSYSKYCGLAILLTCHLYANADAIDRSQARIVAQNIVSIDDSAPDDVALAPYYIFSRGAGKGYVIVSGDDSTAPIIGYTREDKETTGTKSYKDKEQDVASKGKATFCIGFI